MNKQTYDEPVAFAVWYSKGNDKMVLRLEGKQHVAEKMVFNVPTETKQGLFSELDTRGPKYALVGKARVFEFDDDKIKIHD